MTLIMVIKDDFVKRNPALGDDPVLYRVDACGGFEDAIIYFQPNLTCEIGLFSFDNAWLPDYTRPNISNQPTPN
jgi:hypothetical protein